MILIFFSQLDSFYRRPTWTHYLDSEPINLYFSSYCCVLSGEATHTHFIVFHLTRSAPEPTMYANSYTTDAVKYISYFLLNVYHLQIEHKSIRTLPNLPYICHIPVFHLLLLRTCAHELLNNESGILNLIAIVWSSMTTLSCR